ncbi:PAS domain-containing protein [Mucilaginibacter daejeonensis]|uniref:PAS domain-containing protein n=1 Tax=Mucilaginibacter daejeonensis TaxID=398049 RepID=UPI001D179E4A|nr:PAS domain-containing protein [Mucilaginibacter daejeonensis]UEG52408.1 PAS domain-containing protein [Mucilaginibacter daejeonensis]
MDHLENDVAALRALIEESPTPIALYVGPEMRIHIANKAMIYGAWGKDTSVLGQTLKAALPELEGQPFHQLLDDVYRSGIAYEAKQDPATLIIDGRPVERYYNFTYKPLLTTDGQVWGILNTATNVTELVLARKQIVDVEAQLAFSLKAAGIGTWDLDVTNKSITWDDRTKELYGFNRADTASYDQVLRYMHPQDRAVVDKAVRNALDISSGGVYDVRFRTIGADDNKLRWLHCKGKAYFNEKGEPYRFSGIAMDIGAQISADERLRSAEQLTQLALENIDAGSYFIHLPSKDITYTPLFTRVLTGKTELGLERDEFIKHIHPDDVIVRRKAYELAVSSGSLDFEARYVWKDASIHWVRVLGKYTYDDQNDPVYLSGIVQDITAEAEAKQEQRKLLWLIENSTDMISLMDKSGDLTYLNEAGRRMLDIKVLHEDTRKRAAYLMEAELDRVRQVVDPALLTDDRWSGELMFRNTNTGEAIPCFVTTLLLRDTSTGQPLGSASVVRDMRPELAAQKALIDNEELFRAITTASPAALWMTDAEGSITYVNDIWLNWTGRSFDEHLGQGWVEAVVADDRALAGERFVNDFTQRVFHESQFRIQHTDGTRRWIVCTGHPQYHVDGGFKGYIGACVDISEQMHLQQQKDEFIGVASHELKTPVTSVKAYAQVLQTMFEREVDDKKALMLSKMNSQIDRLSSLINDLLDVTKIQSGRLQFHDRHFDLNDLVLEVCEDLQRTAHKHQLITDLHSTAPVHADADRIRQVLTNLITNAIKYSPSAHSVTISSSMTDTEAIISVQDHGIGISADKQPKVFDQFYRVSGSNQHTFPGLGLGLYITAEIIKGEGGRIWLSSVPGEGSIFYFALPLSSGQSIVK